MGRAKAAMMERDENLNWAKRLLAQTRAISECEVHGDYTDNLDEEAVEEAAKLAAANPPKNLSAEEAAELVRQAVLEVGDECSGCASMIASEL